jgi:hypothetical protein
LNNSVHLDAIAYNYGSGVVNKSIALHLLKFGNRNIIRAYASLCHYRGIWHKGLHSRRLTEHAALIIP